MRLSCLENTIIAKPSKRTSKSKGTNLGQAQDEEVTFTTGITLSDSTLKELAKQIAKELVAQEKKRTTDFMTPNDIAEYFGFGFNSTTIRELLKRPDFPKPLEITMGGHKRYRRKDVVKWAEDQMGDDSEKMLSSAALAAF